MAQNSKIESTDMEKTLLAALADKYLAGTATEEEITLLHEWYDKVDQEETEQVLTAAQESKDEVRQRTFAALQSAIHRDEDRQSRRVPRYMRWLAAASVLIALAIAGNLLWRTHKSSQGCYDTTQSPPPSKDLAPGSSRATLLLGNGSVVDLQAVKNGTIPNTSGTRIDKMDGQLIYAVSSSGMSPETNTIRTPRGGLYEIVLPDGSKVWLNAASSLSYPTAFAGKEREVRLKGEAYFEITEDRSKPFKVLIDDMQVDVLGTHFNVMAYDDEPTMMTTLLQGAVKVTKGETSRTLHVGQQAALDRASGTFKMQDIDADESIAWKNGNFQFGGASIETVMRQVARWYDVDVEYQGKTSEHFRGTISRSVNVSEVFRMLELTGAVHFAIEGKKIIVKP